MPNYNCYMCNYSTSIKTHFFKHLKTEKHKKTKELYEEELELNITSLQNTSKILQNTSKIGKNSLQNTSKILQNPPKSSKILQNINYSSDEEDYEDKNKYTCIYCDREFTRIDNLNRHIEHRCKVKKEKDAQEEYYKDLYELEKQERKEEREEHINQLIALRPANYITIDNTKNNLELNNTKNNIDNIENKIDNTTNNTLNNNTSNNNNSINNTLTNNNNKIQVNNYGNENLDMLTDSYMKKMVQYPYTAIPQMIKKIHFNDKYPENKNIRMLNKRSNKIQILNIDRWEYVSKKEAIKELIDDKNYHLDKYYEDNKHQFSDVNQNRFEKFQEKITSSDKNTIKTVNDKTELVFWNNM